MLISLETISPRKGRFALANRHLIKRIQFSIVYAHTQTLLLRLTMTYRSWKNVRIFQTQGNVCLPILFVNYDLSKKVRIES